MSETMNQSLQNFDQRKSSSIDWQDINISPEEVVLTEPPSIPYFCVHRCQRSQQIYQYTRTEPIDFDYPTGYLNSHTNYFSKSKQKSPIEKFPNHQYILKSENHMLENYEDFQQICLGSIIGEPNHLSKISLKKNKINCKKTSKCSGFLPPTRINLIRHKGHSAQTRDFLKITLTKQAMVKNSTLFRTAACTPNKMNEIGSNSKQQKEFMPEKYDDSTKKCKTEANFPEKPFFNCSFSDCFLNSTCDNQFLSESTWNFGNQRRSNRNKERLIQKIQMKHQGINKLGMGQRVLKPSKQQI